MRRAMLRAGGRVLLESHDLDIHERDREGKIEEPGTAGFTTARTGIPCDGMLTRRFASLHHG